MAGDWLLIDIDGAEVNFARSRPNSPTLLSGRRNYASRDFATATDCILRYARDEGIDLRGLTTAIVLSGPVTGDTVRIARCPWIISLTGVGYLVGGRPYALNDSAAKAWADMSHAPLTHRQIGGRAGAPLPNPAGDDGRYIAINVGAGVGATILSNRAAAQIHLEMELGHLVFAPVGPVERALYDALERQRGPVSWERALLTPPADPVWSATSLAGQVSGIARARAAMLGAFCGDAVLAGGAWTGLLIHGTGAAILSQADLAASFNARFEARAGQAAVVRPVPRWTVAMREENLIGAAQYLQARPELAAGRMRAVA